MSFLCPIERKLLTFVSADSLKTERLVKGETTGLIQNIHICIKGIHIVLYIKPFKEYKYIYLKYYYWYVVFAENSNNNNSNAEGSAGGAATTATTTLTTRTTAPTVITTTTTTTVTLAKTSSPSIRIHDAALRRYDSRRIPGLPLPLPFSPVFCNQLRSNEAKTLESKKRVVKMLFVLVLEFFICWTPLYVINTMVMLIGPVVYEYVDYTAISFLQLLAYSSSCCNPITYCFMNASFRRAFVDTFKGLPWRRGGGAGGGAAFGLSASQAGPGPGAYANANTNISLNPGLAMGMGTWRSRSRHELLNSVVTTNCAAAAAADSPQL